MNFESSTHQPNAGSVPFTHQPDTITPKPHSTFGSSGTPLNTDWSVVDEECPQPSMKGNSATHFKAGSGLSPNRFDPQSLSHKDPGSDQFTPQSSKTPLVGDVDNGFWDKAQRSGNTTKALQRPQSFQKASTLGDQSSGGQISALTTTVAPIRMEAESLPNRTAYRVELNGSASNGKMLSFVGGSTGETGSASGSFAGPSGSYKVVVGYYDETDGTAQLEARIAGKSIATWSLNQSLGSDRATSQTLVRRTISTGMTINQGDRIQLLGKEAGKEHARIDYIEFIPVSSSSPVPTPTPSDTQAPIARASANSLTSATTTPQTITVTYEDQGGVKVSTLDSSDIRITGPNGFNQTASFVSVNSSTDGTPRTATYRINAPGGNWDQADNGTYTIAVQGNQVSDRAGNFISAGTLGTFQVNIASSPISPTPKLLFTDTFSNGISGEWDREASRSYSIQTDSSGRSGNAVRFELRRSDPDVHGSKRSELALNPIPANSEMWYGFSAKLAPDWKDDPSSFEIVAQWHEIPDWNLGEDWRSPPLSLSVRGGNIWRISNRWDTKALTINNTPEGTANLWEGKYEPGKWVDWVFHVKWSHRTDGLIQVWKNGQQIVNRTGPNTYNDQTGPYFKMGIYKPDWKYKPSASTVDTRVISFDEVKIGDRNANFSAVSPT